MNNQKSVNLWIGFIGAGLLLFLVGFQSQAAQSPRFQDAHKASVDGGWSWWSWTPCDKGCDTGRRYKIRVCNNPEPQDGGAECIREDGTPTTPGDRIEIDDSVSYGQGYINCHKQACEGPPDDEPPSTPQNLSATVLSESKIRLEWDHSTDNVGVTKYRVYDGRGFNIGVSEETYYTPANYQFNVYTVTLLAPSTTYTFDITALDARGNESDHSLPVSATTQPFPLGTGRINPYTDIVYKGAFQFPESSGNCEWGRWGYSGEGFAFYPDGDASGPDDGYPGSLFGSGHVYDRCISEISIPQPLITSDWTTLNTAETLQPFSQIDTFPHPDLTIPIGDIAYLPRQGSQQSDKLYYIFGSNYNWSKIPSHCASELDLSNPQTQGWWYVGAAEGHPPYYSTVYYLFDIPQDWADTYTGGRRLITGGTRSGAYNGFGTAFFAIGPWLDGDPPPFEAELSYVTLTEYGQVSGVNTQDGREVTDQFFGGAWVERSAKAAIVLIGNKGYGETTYDGGYTSVLYRPVLMFYDPNDLAAVTQGHLQPHEPQPYAMIDIGEFMFNIEPTIGSGTYDAQNGLLYLYEDNQENPLMHVFQFDVVPEAILDLRITQAHITTDTLTADLSWTPLAQTITQTVYYSASWITAANWPQATVLTSTLSGGVEAYTAVVPYNGDGSIYFALRAYLQGDLWSPLSNVVFYPSQDLFLPLISR